MSPLSLVKYPNYAAFRDRAVTLWNVIRDASRTPRDRGWTNTTAALLKKLTVIYRDWEGMDWHSNSDSGERLDTRFSSEENRTSRRDTWVQDHFFPRGLKVKTAPAQQITGRDQISCIVIACPCYLFVSFECEYCHEVRVTHCQRGYRPRGFCTKCLEEK